MMVRDRLRAALLVPLLAVMMSCADTPHWISQIRDEPPPPVEDAAASARAAVRQARRHMQSGDYQKAIDVYHAGYQKAPRDQTLRLAYQQSLEQMAAGADQALERQKVGSAGKTYAILFNNYARFEGFAKDLSFTRTGLNKKLDFCKKTLFRQGFQEYRQGNLSQSIALWEDLLVIDPENTDIREALRTARLQQKNLNATE